MPELHSAWGASGFEQAMLCPGSRVLQAGMPRSTSKYAAEGTAAHQVLTWALQEQRPASAYIGRLIQADGFEFEVDDDMARHVQVCADYAIDVAGDDGVILVDRRVCYASYLGLDDDEAWGTLDVAVLKGDEIICIDFKYGMGVEVQAGDDKQRKPNPQLALYALGALAEFGDFGDFKRARLVISQPRISVKPSEYDLSVEELVTWGTGAARSAVATCRNAADSSVGWPEVNATPAWSELFLRPGEKQCRFCKAKATCPALREDLLDTFMVKAATPDEFDNLGIALPPAAAEACGQDWLEAVVAKADMFEDMFKAARAELERRLFAGKPSTRFKVVQGKRGARQWADPKAAEALLRETFRLPIEKAYDLKLISPTSAEKLHKAGDIGPRQWPKAQSLITQPDGKPHVAPVSDPRPALVVTPVVEDFDTVTTDLSDLA